MGDKYLVLNNKNMALEKVRTMHGRGSHFFVYIKKILYQHSVAVAFFKLNLSANWLIVGVALYLQIYNKNLFSAISLELVKLQNKIKMKHL